jgi:hypothetical protein
VTNRATKRGTIGALAGYGFVSYPVRGSAMTDTATASGSVSNDKTKLTDSIRAAFSGDAPVGDKLKSLYKARPVATVALAGVLGIALLNTLRGVRR